MQETPPRAKRTETIPDTGPARIDTDRPDLQLVEMTTPQDDNEYFAFQQRNATHIAEFGNVSPQRSWPNAEKMRFGSFLASVRTVCWLEWSAIRQIS